MNTNNSNTSDAQRNAIKKYKRKLNRITVDFSPAEIELWLHLQEQSNKQGYIKRLIRLNMKSDFENEE